MWPAVLFAPTELKVRAKMYSLHVSWQPPHNHTQISGYKLAYQMLDTEDGEGSEKKKAPVQPIKLRKRVRHHDITDLGETAKCTSLRQMKSVVCVRLLNFLVQMFPSRDCALTRWKPGLFKCPLYLSCLCLVCVLVPGRVYQVKVWAYNKQTEGYPAVWKGCTEKSSSLREHATKGSDDPSPPLPPSGIKATANSSRSIWLRWERPRFSSVRIINYTVRCSPAGLRNASLVSYYTR